MSKRVLCLILALCMVGTLCSFAHAENVASLLHPYEETVQVTIMGTDEKDNAVVYDSSKHDRASANENAWIDAYKDLLNIEVTRITPEDTEALNANLNTMMASGELPDIMIVSKEMFYVLAENGVLRDVKADFDAYDGELWNEIKNSFSSEIWETGMYEGEMLGIPGNGNFYGGTAVLWVRQDWLDALGLSVPTTLDEMEAVAQAFVDNKMGGEETVGIGLVSMDAWDLYCSAFGSILAAYGVPINTWVQTEDGQYVFSNTLPAVKAGLLRMQEMYKKGLIKKDFSVTTTNEEDVSNGKCGMYTAPGWHSVTAIHANIMNDENAVWTPARIPTLDGAYVKQTTDATVDKFIVVNANYEHPDVIFRMKELEAYVRFHATASDPMYQLMVTDDNFTMWNLMVFRGLQRGDLDLYQSKLCTEARQNNTPVEEVAPLGQAMYEKCKLALDGDRSWLQYLLVFTEAYPIASDLLERGYLVAGYNGPLTENMNLYQKTIDASLLSAMAKVVMGDDASVFDKAVEDWYANGGQAITDDVNAYYASK